MIQFLEWVSIFYPSLIFNYSDVPFSIFTLDSNMSALLSGNGINVKKNTCWLQKQRAYRFIFSRTQLCVCVFGCMLIVEQGLSSWLWEVFEIFKSNAEKFLNANADSKSTRTVFLNVTNYFITCLGLFEQ